MKYSRWQGSRLLSLFGGIGVALLAAVPVQAQVSLEDLCRTYPSNSRCQRVQQGLPAVNTGISVPSDGTCQPMTVSGGTTTVVHKTSGYSSPPPLRWIGLKDGNRTQFNILESPSYSRYIGTILSESLGASYTIKMVLQYKNGSDETVYGVSSLPMSEQHLHGFEGNSSAGAAVESVIITVSRPGGSIGGRYRLELFGCL